MDSGYYAAMTGLVARTQALDTAAANLANAQTPGFRAEREFFRSVLLGPDALDSQLGKTVNNYGLLGGDRLNLAQGALTQTGNSLDLAINGRGFFQVLMPDGTMAYTRDGSFQTNATGQVVTASGYVLQPAITIPSGAQSITIGSDGTVSVLLAGQTAPSTVGTLQLADFINEAGLQPYGQNLLLPSAASGTAQTANPGLSGMGTLQQGATESSNVDVVSEMVNMIETQRAYEMDSKAIQTTDQMLQNLSTSL